jgi:hypothetical protein
MKNMGRTSIHMRFSMALCALLSLLSGLSWAAARTYSIFVRPPGGSELTVGTNFAFRTEQSGVTSLNWWGVNVNSGTPGSSTVCNFTLSP